MSRAFMIDRKARNASQPKPRKVFVTGAAGRIGAYFAEHAAEQHELTLLDLPDADMSHVEQFGKVVRADLADLDKLKQAMAGADTVLHLAAGPSPSVTWDTVIQTNITGTYNVFVAARAAGCRRVVFASSIHAVSAYPVGVQIKPDDPVNPGDLYGVSKCFGEAMGRYMATQQDLSVIAIRIGAFQPIEAARDPDKIGMMNTFVSWRDLNQLIHRCIDDESIRYAIVHGLSNNVFNQMDISETRDMLGYEPEDDFSEENPSLRKLHLRDQVRSHSERGHDQAPGIRKEL
ncbi:MAG: NAD(P)-dependent oxidoreductase [Phycisphaeraceae bacterium]